jgi:hypothetical protein
MQPIRRAAGMGRPVEARFAIEAIDHPPDVGWQKRDKKRFQVVLRDSQALIGNGVFHRRIDVKTVSPWIDNILRRVGTQVNQVPAPIAVPVGVGLSDHVSAVIIFIG